MHVSTGEFLPEQLSIRLPAPAVELLGRIRLAYNHVHMETLSPTQLGRRALIEGLRRMGDDPQIKEALAQLDAGELSAD